MRASKEFSPATRALIVQRDDYRCARCARYFPEGQGLNIHHRLMRSHGGMGVAENGISLCGSGTTGCHGWVHGHPERAAQLGFIVLSWDEPSERPVHTWKGIVLLTVDGEAKLLAPEARSVPQPPDRHE